MKKFWLLAIPAALCAAAVVSACASDDAVEAETYRVVYMNGDKVFFRADVKHGEKLPVPKNDPERKDEGNVVYTFAGWTDEAEGGVDDIVDPGEVTSVTSDLTYYAVFNATSYYTVTFMDGVTGLPIDEQKVPAGGDAVAPEKVPEHEGYEFAEWDGSFTDISARTTVTAVYKKLSYTLSLDVLGVITETPVEYGAALAPAAPATVAGLKFDGWYIKGEEGEPVPLSEAYESMPAHAVEAYAEFSVDWTGVGIALPANAVYGGEGATIAHPAYGNMTYTHIWGDESRGDSYVFGGAGLQTVSATIIAVFENENGAYISERRSFEKTVNVGKAELEITASVANLSNGSVVYGTAPAAEFTFSGFVGEDDSSDLGSVSAVYTFENGQPADAEKLEAGAYIISASLEDDNYIANVRTSLFLVKPRDITLTLTAGDITYGAQPEFTVSADKSQFAYGEDISVLRQGTVVIKKDGAVVSGNLAAGSYTAETDGYKNANYNVIPGTAQFTVKKAALTATVSVEDSYEYGTEVTPVLEYAGFVFGDDEKVLTAQTVVSFAGAPAVSGLLTAGDYTVTANGATADNYTIEYKYTNEKFTVKPLGLRVTISATGVSGVKWRGAVTNAALELDGRFIVSGEIALKDEYTKAAIYAGLGNGMGEYFEWSQALKITLNGIDVTDNFVVNSYSLYVELKNSAFKVTSTGEVNTPYTGSPITLGTGVDVEGAPAGMKIEYSLDGNSWSEDIPTATEAGTYNVHYRLSADNYDEFTGTFTSVISNANNHIEQIAQYDSVIYDGQAHTFADFGTYFKADFGTVTLKTAGSNVFTDAGTYTFVVCVDGNDNYAYAELKVTVTINKAKYTDGQIPGKVLRADTLYCVPGEENIITAEDLAAGFSFPAGTSSVEYTNGENKLTLVYNADGSVNKNYEPAQTDRFVTAWYKVQVVLNDNAAFTARVNTLSQFNGNISELIRAVEAPEGLDPAINKDNIATYLSCDSQAVVFNAGGTYPVIYTAADTLADSYIKIVFGREESDSAVVPFKVTSVKVGEELYTIEDALLNAKANDTFIVTANTSFADSSVIDIYGVNATVADGKSVYGFTLGSNVTLLLPYDQSKIAAADANCEDNTASAQAYADTNPSFLKLTLTVPDYISLDVNGTVSIGAVLGSTGQGLSGHTSGAYAQITLNGTLDLNSGSKLYSYGYIKGTGKVNAYSGSEMTSPFVVRDFRGGTYTAASYNSSIAPFSQYELPNIQTHMHIVYGAKYYARASLYASGGHNTTIATIIGDGGLIQLKENGYIETSFEHITDTTKYGNTTAAGITTLELFGGAKDNTLSLDVGVSVTTSSCLLGIPYNFNLIFVEGTYEIDMQYKLMPGASIEIGEEASVIFNNKLIVYTNDFVDKEAIGYLYPTNVDDATLKVSGSATFNKGFGGNISAQSGATITFGAGVALTIESEEAIKHSGFLLISWISEKQTITKSAQLAGYTGSIAAGKTYVYDGSGWVEQPAQQA